jgi:hypothetical protein
MMKVILVDIDGTIALRGDRSPHDHDSSMEDAVNWPVVKVINAYVKEYEVGCILLSGRDEKYRDVTEYWLGTHNIVPYRNKLIMRKEKDNRPDEIVKEELYHNQISPFYKVEAVFDDRNKVVAMWRRLGLTVFQVADGDF